MSQPKATIIGGSGFIGSHLCSRLSKLNWLYNTPNQTSILKHHKDMGHIFYCAGLTSDYEQRPFDTVEAHVSLLNKILKNCRFQSLTYLSSTRLYDSLTCTIASEELALSLNPGQMRHLYDLSKALGESLCLAMGKGRARIARLSCVYNDHTDNEGFLPGLLQQIITQNQTHININSSPYFTRDYIHIQDVIDALILIATKGSSFIYNVASGENISNKALFSTLSDLSHCKIKPTLYNRPKNTCTISIEKMQTEFNWKPVPVCQAITTILKENLSC